MNPSVTTITVGYFNGHALHIEHHHKTTVTSRYSWVCTQCGTRVQSLSWLRYCEHIIAIRHMLWVYAGGVPYMPDDRGLLLLTRLSHDKNPRSRDATRACLTQLQTEPHETFDERVFNLWNNIISKLT